jgi:protein-L-isoaspartate(D-aspartate) O-methyltransferase
MITPWERSTGRSQGQYMDKYERERRKMVNAQLVKRGLKDTRVLAAFESVPRHLFVPEEYQFAAYEDRPLPIGHSQTISQPYIVALMTELLRLQGWERVLEIGTGSGYQAAILAALAAEVYSVEYVPGLAAQAVKTFQELGIDNIHIHVGDGSMGWPEAAPYHGILVTAAAPEVPKPLLQQLEDGGRLVIPVGGRGTQNLEIWERKGKDYECKIETAVAFVPLLGEQGWDRKEWNNI